MKGTATYKITFSPPGQEEPQVYEVDVDVNFKTNETETQKARVLLEIEDMLAKNCFQVSLINLET